MEKIPLSINIKGRLLDFRKPKVMAIINVTPDSFYSGSRGDTAGRIKEIVSDAIEEGADILDVGGCSTRPGSEAPTPAEEYDRLCRGLEIIKAMAPECIVSIDTWRAEVARKCVEEWEADIINDIGFGRLDPDMFETVADLDVPYILTHSRGTPSTMDKEASYEDVTAEVLTEFSKAIYELRDKKVKDIILDPGFGFAKTVEQNFKLLAELDEICKIGLPVMAALSRKSMIRKTLGCDADSALGGTIALNAIAVEKGANILRVHDVKAAVETVKLHQALKNQKDD